MISNRAASIARAGIMFATTGDPDRPFPSLPDLRGEHGTPAIHEHLSYSFPIEDFPGWMLVACDPTRFHYHDEDNEAMDLSNWSVVEGALGDYATEINYGGPITDENIQRNWRRNLDDAYQFGAFITDRMLIVAPIVGADGTCGAWAPPTFAGDSPYSCDLSIGHEGDHEHHEDDDTTRSWEDDEAWIAHVERVGELARLADSLADYPLLDEEDYFEREHEAWCEWAESGGLRYDAVRDMHDAGWHESLVDAIDEAWSDIWPIASQYLDESRGFYGECSPDFHEAIARAINAGELTEILASLDEAPTSEDEGDEDEDDSPRASWSPSRGWHNATGVAPSLVVDEYGRIRWTSEDEGEAPHGGA